MCATPQAAPCRCGAARSLSGVSVLVGLAHRGGSAIHSAGDGAAASSASTLHENGPLTVIAATHGKWCVFAVDGMGLGKLLFRAGTGRSAARSRASPGRPTGGSLRTAARTRRRRTAFTSSTSPAVPTRVSGARTQRPRPGSTSAGRRTGRALAFDSPERGVGTINADGSGQQALPLPAGAADRSPSWPPTARESHMHVRPRAGEAVYTSAVDGSARRLVTKHGALPSWSPDGKRIALLDGCTLRLYTPSGRDVTRGPSTGCSTWGTPLSAPVWSPDARKLAVMTTNGLWTLAANGTQLTHQHAGAWSLSRARGSWSRPAWRAKPQG